MKVNKLIAASIPPRKIIHGVIVAERVCSESIPYLAVSKYTHSEKALGKKRKRICHELNNATEIVLKEIAGI